LRKIIEINSSVIMLQLNWNGIVERFTSEFEAVFVSKKKVRRTSTVSRQTAM
jgi:hypothetical protein